ncbi:hypothetical protein POM88_037983 [Heracleum sosnowskyi]|uniref:Uncharacterized protein n=1 Tax=Heracleum sosnowskyi TaxID=360622 RepID=A0AAD8HS63_9APIA|nr:hypothetical protein POM88_037983 [Heracleum sosnowskyi]
MQDATRSCGNVNVVSHLSPLEKYLRAPRIGLSYYYFVKKDGKDREAVSQAALGKESPNPLRTGFVYLYIDLIPYPHLPPSYLSLCRIVNLYIHILLSHRLHLSLAQDTLR